MIFDIVTIFPELLESPLQEGIIRRARVKQLIDIEIIDLRQFASGPHAMTDDRPFGGGEGMVMKPEPLAAAVASRQKIGGLPKIILLSPQGRRYDQTVAEELAQEEHLVLVCGRYEGVDERFREQYVDLEISIGDFILTGGELAAMVLIDSITRLLPGVLGCAESAMRDTFSRRLLKHPQYTRPQKFNEQLVPNVLLSGDHAAIKAYRFIASVKRTLQRRPDMICKEAFSDEEIVLLKKHNLFALIQNIQGNCE